MATEENTIGFKVDKSVIDDFVSGKRKSFSVDIDEDTYKDLLENVDGHLLVDVDYMLLSCLLVYFVNLSPNAVAVK